MLVGAGAVGCEWIKILAKLGACCGEKGKLVIVDDDIFERSNLHRISIAKLEDLQKLKAEVAAMRSQLLCHPDDKIKVSWHNAILEEKNESKFNY